ncbi:hypothetical protein CA592_09395 [Anoxybacillus flavithermus]|nr:hypothetical protein CA592_09395 [Anoxybacillus flavithermus]
MSGPSLRKLEAHRSIHHGAFVEAKRLTELLETLYADGRCGHAAEVADALRFGACHHPRTDVSLRRKCAYFLLQTSSADHRCWSKQLKSLYGR